MKAIHDSHYPIQCGKRLPANEFVSFNHLLKTLILEGHIESGSRGADGQLLSTIHQQLKTEEVLRVVIRLDQLNVPTIRLLFDVFKAASRRLPSRRPIRICWFCSYQDQQMIKTGLDLGELYDLEVTVLPI